MDHVYKIKKSLKTPMVLAVLISIPVFIDVVLGGFELKILIMAIALMVLFYLFTINNLLRSVRITDSEITITSLFGRHRFPLQETAFFDGMVMGSRQFVTISSKKKSHLIPNSFEKFPRLIEDILSVAPENTVGEGLLRMKEHTVTRKSDITVSWITVILLLLIILVRFFPHWLQ
ncbi:MAG: hypothetical protein RRA35_02345 [Desulfomonilia bacterium]|nr:hypothetical protein [Desulfomonilia bacterium]